MTRKPGARLCRAVFLTQWLLRSTSRSFGLHRRAVGVIAKVDAAQTSLHPFIWGKLVAKVAASAALSSVRQRSPVWRWRSSKLQTTYQLNDEGESESHVLWQSGDCIFYRRWHPGAQIGIGATMTDVTAGPMSA